jgi:hypothetical protein
MLIMLLLFSGLLFAEEMSTEKYCFQDPLQVVQKKILSIQVPSDVVKIEGNCLVMGMKPHRRELIQKYILSSFPGSYLAFSSEQVRRELCKIRVEKIKSKDSHATNTLLNDQAGVIYQTETVVNTNESIDIETVKEFEVTINQGHLLGTCKYITQNRYEISIKLMNNPSGNPSTDQETKAIQTQVQIARGDKIEIGGLLRKAISTDERGTTAPEVSKQIRNQYFSEKVYLSLQ